MAARWEARRQHCCRASAKLPSPPPSWPPLPLRCHRCIATAYAAAATLRSRQAAAAAAKLAAASNVLPPRFRRHRRRRFHRHRRRCHRRRCRRCIQLIVDCCLCPRHRCHRRCLHRHRGGARWQNGGCRGHAQRRRAADVLPDVAATAALPASRRCRQAAAATAATALLPHLPPRCCRR